MIARSATGFSVSVSVAELLPGTGSVTPGGTDAVAVLASTPRAEATTVASTVNVAVPPATRSTRVLTLPEPLGEHADPAVAVHVHVAPVSSTGNESVTATPATSDGPRFVTTTVYCTAWPGVADDEPSVLRTSMSACRTMVVVSVAWLLAGVGSIEPTGIATSTVFVNVPGAVDASSVPVTVNVVLPPLSSVTSSLTLPDPDALPHVEPADAVHVHETPTMLAGTTSVTDAPAMADGPALVTTIV